MEAPGSAIPSGSLRGRFVRRALQAAVVDVILPAFAEQVLASLAAAPRRAVTSRPAAPSICRPAPTTASSTRRARADSRRLGASARRHRPRRARRAVCERHLDPGRRPRAARRCRRGYREIVGEPEQPPRRRVGEPTAPASTATARRGGRERGEDAGSPGSLADALEQAIATARDGQLEQLDHDIDLGQVLARAAAGGQRGRSSGGGAAPGCRPGGCPTAASTARRTRTRCSRLAVTPTGCAGR